MAKVSAHISDELDSRLQKAADRTHKGRKGSLLADLIAREFGTAEEQPPVEPVQRPIIALAQAILPASVQTLDPWIRGFKRFTEADFAHKLLYELMWQVRLDPKSDPTAISISADSESIRQAAEDKAEYPGPPIVVVRDNSKRPQKASQKK